MKDWNKVVFLQSTKIIDVVKAINEAGTQFAVIEAKAKTKGQSGKLSHVKRQSEFYFDAFCHELRHTSHSVRAGYVTDRGFSWLSEETEDILDGGSLIETKAVSDAGSPDRSLVLPREESTDAKTPGSIASSNFETRKKELDAMTIQGGLRDLLDVYGLTKTGRKADLIDRILEHEQQQSSSTSDAAPVAATSWVTPSRREQLEAMNIQHELQALCYLYGVRPARKLKKEFVDVIWSFENSTPGISAGF